MVAWYFRLVAPCYKISSYQTKAQHFLGFLFYLDCWCFNYAVIGEWGWIPRNAVASVMLRHCSWTSFARTRRGSRNCSSYQGFWICTNFIPHLLHLCQPFPSSSFVCCQNCLLWFIFAPFYFLWCTGVVILCDLDCCHFRGTFLRLPPGSFAPWQISLSKKATDRALTQLDPAFVIYHASTTSLAVFSWTFPMSHANPKLAQHLHLDMLMASIPDGVQVKEWLCSLYTMFTQYTVFLVFTLPYEKGVLYTTAKAYSITFTSYSFVRHLVGSDGAHEGFLSW